LPGARDQRKKLRFLLDRGCQRRLILRRDGVLQAASEPVEARLDAWPELRLRHEPPLNVVELTILLHAHQRADEQHRQERQDGGPENRE
jgi:hypothetical protein